VAIVIAQAAGSGRALRHAWLMGLWEPYAMNDGDGVWMLTALPDGSYIIDTPWGEGSRALGYDADSDRVFIAERTDPVTLVKWRLVQVEDPMSTD
jgi:hypothetical protein